MCHSSHLKTAATVSGTYKIVLKTLDCPIPHSFRRIEYIYPFTLFYWLTLRNKFNLTALEKMNVIPLNTFIVTDMKNYILNRTALEEKYSHIHSITLDPLQHPKEYG